jgi:hypothetical protein
MRLTGVGEAISTLTLVKFLILIFVRGWVGLKAIVRLKGLGKAKKKIQ